MDGLSRIPLPARTVEGAASAIDDELDVMLIEPSSDEWLRGMDHLLRTGNAPQSWSEKEVKHLLRKSPHFCIAHGTLYHMGRGGVMQRVVATEDRIRVLQGIHDDAGHYGTQLTLKRLLDRYF